MVRSSNTAKDSPILYKFPKEWNENIEHPFKQSYTSNTDKCFSFDLNIESNSSYGIKEIHLLMIGKQETSSRGYYDGFFPDYNERLNLKMFLTYPNQLIRSFDIFELRSLNHQKWRNLVNIEIQAMEILHRRSKKDSPCNENWRNYDNELIEQLVSKIGCHPPHWSWLSSDYPMCENSEQLFSLRVPSLSTGDTEFLKNFPPPCREIQTITSTSTIKNATLVDMLSLISGPDNKNKKQNVEEHFNQNEIFTKFVVRFKMLDYKLVTVVQAFNEETLIGNLGGYIGLFLGFAIWQTPELLSIFFSIMKTLMNSCTTNNVENKTQKVAFN